ncbi:hypothetical protein [Parasitella parasitica]|uniref:Uncharacterized protein n=1 Tax=Parasitella parasitica TaxID=35722 RepID=A0A0B7NWM4_9FUNG|nr:hypothetical protein [Parasitella parasitica]
MGLNNWDAQDLFSDEKKMTLIIKPTAPPPRQLTTNQLLIEQFFTIIFPSENTQRRWSLDQVRELFRKHFVGSIKVTHAARLSEINSNTALGYIRQAKNGLNKQPEEETSAELVLKGNLMLGEEHNNFLGWFFDEHEGATLKDGHGVLRQNYKLLISESGLRRHLLKKCALTCKVFEYGELHGVYLNGQQIHVGTINFLFFERQQFGWP